MHVPSQLPDLNTSASAAKHDRLAAAVDWPLQTTAGWFAIAVDRQVAVHAAAGSGRIQIERGILRHTQRHTSTGSRQLHLLGQRRGEACGDGTARSLAFDLSRNIP